MKIMSSFARKLLTSVTMALVTSCGAANAGSQTAPGRTTGFAVGPVPEGLYFTGIADYGTRADTSVGVVIPDFFWATPWKVFGASLAIEAAPAWVDVGQTNTSYVNGMFNPFGAAHFGWDLGGGFKAGYTVGGYVPYKSSVAGNFFTFEQKFGLSYVADGWNLTGRFIWGLPGSDQNTGITTAPNYLNFDLTATKKIGKWEVGLVGFASSDLNRPFAAYAVQKQVALGGLVGYDFGPAALRIKATRTLAQTNYGGDETRVWTDLSFPLWTPEQPSQKPRLFTKY